MFTKKIVSMISLAALLTAASISARAADVTDEMILKDATTPTSVLTYGLGLQGQRFSPLKQINHDSVKGLVPAWSFSFGGEKQRGQESQAIVHDGIIYVTGSYSRLYAINSKTGEKLWQYDASSRFYTAPNNGLIPNDQTSFAQASFGVPFSPMCKDDSGPWTCGPDEGFMGRTHFPEQVQMRGGNGRSK